MRLSVFEGDNIVTVDYAKSKTVTINAGSWENILVPSSYQNSGISIESCYGDFDPFLSYE